MTATTSGVHPFIVYRDEGQRYLAPLSHLDVFDDNSSVWYGRIHLDLANLETGHRYGGDFVRADLWLIPASHVDEFIAALEQDRKARWLDYEWFDLQGAEEIDGLCRRLGLVEGPECPRHPFIVYSNEVDVNGLAHWKYSAGEYAKLGLWLGAVDVARADTEIEAFHGADFNRADLWAIPPELVGEFMDVLGDYRVWGRVDYEWLGIHTHEMIRSLAERLRG